MEASPYRAPTAPVADVGPTAGIEVTWARAVKVWWSIAWRLMLFGALAGFVIGFIVGVIGAAAGAQQQTISLLGTLTGFLAAIPVGIWVVRNVLRKSWSDFDIALVARQG